MLNITVSIEDNRIICKANQEIASLTLEIDKKKLLDFTAKIPGSIESIMRESTSEKIDPIFKVLEGMNDQLAKLHERADKEAKDLKDLKDRIK